MPIQITGRTLAGVAASVRPSGAGYVTYESLYSVGDSLSDVAAKVTGGDILTLPPGTFTISDFSDGYYDGLRLGSGGIGANCKGIVGSGSSGANMTTIEFVADSSTVYADLVSITTGFTSGTNPASVLTLANTATGGEFGHFRLVGHRADTNDHDYNGLRIDNSHGANVHDLVLVGASRGTDKVPPGETFGINLYRSNNVTLSDIEVDGRDVDSGARVGASPVGWNGSGSGPTYLTGAAMYRVNAHHGRTGMPTWWIVDDVYTEDCISYSNALGTTEGPSSPAWNHENVLNVTHVNVTCKPWGRWETNHGNTDSELTLNSGTHMAFGNSSVDMASCSIDVNTDTDRGPHIASGGCFAVLIDTEYPNQAIVTLPSPVTRNAVTLTHADSLSVPGGADITTHWIRYR